MKIPRKLKIGAHNYTIKEIDGIIESGNRNSEHRHSILLNKRLCQTEKETTLFHEILHAINNELNETDVEFLTQALYQVLKDNNLLR